MMGSVGGFPWGLSHVPQNLISLHGVRGSTFPCDRGWRGDQRNTSRELCGQHQCCVVGTVPRAWPKG